MANSNIPEAQRILAEAKGEVGDDGETEYTFECTKCEKHIPCRLVIPFSVIDTTICIDGAAEGDFKLVEQHKNVVKEDVKKGVVEQGENVKEEVNEASLPL